MKKILLSIIFAHITTLGFSQQTYMPDDYLENYFETNSGVSFNNDNYVSTTILANTSSISIYTTNTIDFTGIQDMGTTSGIYIFTINNCSNTIIDLSAMPNLINHPLNSLGGGVQGMGLLIDESPFLTQLILPPNRIQLSMSGYLPYLSNIKFQNSNILSSIGIMAGNGIVYMPSLICLDLSNISDVLPGGSLIIFASNLAVLKLNNGKCNKWGTVSLQTAVGACVSVDNPTFCYTAQSLGAWSCSQDWPNQVACTYTTNCSNCISNLDEIQSAINYSISPNPTSSKITVKSLLELIGKEFIIYDQLGKEVMSGLITSEETEIDLSNISEGVYLFKVGTDMKETFKIIKQ
jgi:hypothetical protein